MIERKFGHSERDLVQTLLMLGHARIHDLTQAFASRSHKNERQTNGSHKRSNGTIESGTQFQSVLARLIRAEIIEAVLEDSFRSPMDMHQEITQDVTKTAPGEKASVRDRADQEKRIAEHYRIFLDRGRELKHWVDQNQGPSVTKRRKLENGKAINGGNEEETVPDFNVSRYRFHPRSACDKGLTAARDSQIRL
jgi:DNA-directed RNA polymerase III subunit RPC3